MAENLEYQARFRADTSELRDANEQLAETGEQMYGLNEAASGLVVGMTGFKDVLNGSTSGLLAMAYGAGTAWKALANLNPVLKGLAIALAAAQAAQMLWSHFSEKAAKSAEEEKRAIEELGLELSDLEKHNRAIEEQANQFERGERAAKAYAEAIDRVADAQRNLNQAFAGAQMAGLELEEAQALSDPSLSESQRQNIQRDFINKKADAAKQAAIQEFADAGGAVERERAAIAASERADGSERRVLWKDAAGADQLLKSELAAIAEKIAASGDGSNLKSATDYSLSGMTGEEARKQAKADAQRKSEDFLAAATSGDYEALSSEFGSDIVKLGDTNKLKALFAADRAAQDALSNFDSASAARVTERAGRREAADIAAQSLSQNLASTLMSIEASRKAALAGFGTSAENAEDPYAGARAARDRYRFNQMSDPEKLAEMQTRMGQTRSDILATSDDATRGKLLEQLVNQQEQADTIKGRIDADGQSRADKVSEHKDAIEELRNYRSTQAMDVQGVFRHMYNVQAGKNPDEQVADNTAQIAQHMDAIQKILEGTASA